ncbi:XrtB/PEP-CTERM-associated transcriptional regulator EpsA [Roseateles toxinivorans]|uniref:LuxR family transcriptional regulator n=1 Tax=Roseateles toxinivorans TaxID=270368 RepID=A0A4R6QK12_9BURK|nr:XrtB/PEP-CTERM-associated transcriptional regulator EpsA [Roseateles toxinivorans]TDP64076.1 LuxR family transcriptional regulator [Roseateles toxinivorans]
MPSILPNTVPNAELLRSSHAEAIVRVVETAIDVGRRYQFFVWTQSHLQVLLPHKLAVCGAYQRARRELHFEVFNSVSLPEPVLGSLVDGRGPLLQYLAGSWIDKRGKSLAIDVAALDVQVFGKLRDDLLAAGLGELLVHGVSRPQRPSEIESLFIFASPGLCSSAEQRMYLDLLLPHLHSTWLRVQAVEREMKEMPAAMHPVQGLTRALITERERQILSWVREGMSNQQIGEVLGISPLTVKNHVQKILRKLGANNRAQAVASAMTMNLLGRSPRSEGSV